MPQFWKNSFANLGQNRKRQQRSGIRLGQGSLWICLVTGHDPDGRSCSSRSIFYRNCSCCNILFYQDSTALWLDSCGPVSERCLETICPVFGKSCFGGKLTGMLKTNLRLCLFLFAGIAWSILRTRNKMSIERHSLKTLLMSYSLVYLLCRNGGHPFL